MHSVVPSVAIKNHRELVACLAEVDDILIAAPPGTLLAGTIEKGFLDPMREQYEFVDAA
jgi:hypothetical protein